MKVNIQILFEGKTKPNQKPLVVDKVYASWGILKATFYSMLTALGKIQAVSKYLISRIFSKKQL